jgi:uroporphyrinogen decarboxylase
MLKTKDTALLSRGDRSWAQEGFGKIRSWKDFYDYPWEKAEHVINMSEYLLNFMSKHLPDGMKIGVMAVMFENALEFLLGFNGLFLGIYDYPDLVEAVIEKLGEMVLKYYTLVSQMDFVGFIIHGDDLGYKSSTMLSVEYLKKYIFTWFEKYSLVVHKFKKPFWLHSCGNKDAVMETLINDVKIDGLHSFEDNCCSIADYKEKYGDRITLLGGVDMHKLISLEENELRKYIRNILGYCMKNGMYAFGTGNTVCNYLPLEKYIIMREEEINWSF